MNRTPFAATKLVLPDEQGQEAVLVLVRAAFSARGPDPLRPADPQPEIPLGDIYVAPERPESSSILHEAEVALHKPRVDVLLSGSARSPAGHSATQLRVELAVADIRKELMVSGDRDWTLSVLGRRPSSPRPFLAMPLVYERAFGGSIRNPQGEIVRVDARNPLGIGFEGARSADPQVASLLPNIEYLRDRMDDPDDRPVPAGLGVVGRGWLPRLPLAGTYDDRWRARRWPLLPEDFQPEHYQCAPRDQQSATLVGGETVRVRQVTESGDWQFRLPRLDVPVTLMFDGAVEHAVPRLDTVLIDADREEVSMTLRLCVRTRRNRGLLREIVVGHATPAYLRASGAGKRFIDWSGGRSRVPCHD
ncbi:MAG TPA: DUF2169 domain-containing protein [Albitalea sp.]|uniref:DUF2169 family type VI secretion system accessory protein n=1 Tax=Piscinibacter sp. TaxID=1903157 RepID=UPI002ED40FED